MSLTPAFSVSQSPLAPNIISFQDISTGSDGSLTQRRIYIQDANGNYVVPSGSNSNYIIWPIADTTISIDVLTTDIAANVTVQWLTGSTVTYTSNSNYCFPQFNKQFFYYLWQQQSLKPSTWQDANYSGNITLLWSYITGAINAVEIGNDIASSQNTLNMANQMRLNETKYF